MILQHLGELLEREPRSPRGTHAVIRKTLAACALTQRTWRRLSQTFLHRVVTISCGSFKKSLGRYIEAPQGHHPISADISQYPRQLRILSNDVGRGGEVISDEFKAFVQRCGPRITRLSFVANSFSYPIQVLNVLGQFTSLEEVSIYQRWPASVPQFTLDTYDLSSVVPPAPSLKSICVRTDHQGLLRMVRDWLMVNPSSTTRYIAQSLQEALEVHTDTKSSAALGDSFSRPPPTLASSQIIGRSDQKAHIQSGIVLGGQPAGADVRELSSCDGCMRLAHCCAVGAQGGSVAGVGTGGKSPQSVPPWTGRRNEPQPAVQRSRIPLKCMWPRYAELSNSYALVI